MGDLRRSGWNMGFLWKRTFNHFSRFGIGGLLSIASILISVSLERSLIILYYVNFLAISRVPFPAIMGDFPERYFDEDRKSEIQNQDLKDGDFDRGSGVDQESDLNHWESELGNAENQERENPKPGDRSPVPPSHLPCHKNFSDFFFIPALTNLLNWYMIIMIIIVIKDKQKWPLYRREGRINYEIKAKVVSIFCLGHISGNRGAPGILSHPG